mgnify:CR=1 FL=1
MKNKLIWLLGLSVVLTACDVDNTLDPIEEVVVPDVALSAGSADFSNYIAIGASFTAGFTDGALFQASQVNSFPNIMANKFSMVNGGAFGQPLMDDNIGGMITSTGAVAQSPRLFFNGSGPAVLPAKPTTIVGVPVSNAGSLNNYGVPGAKSFHLLAPGYGSVAGLLNTPPTANPYYVRMAPTQPTLIEEAASKNPTFFTLSEIGGNDVLGYATSGGESDMMSDNYNPITPVAMFNGAFDGIIAKLTGPNPNAKGVVANVPYIASLPHFTTVPYNPLDPTEKTDAARALAAQIPLLNQVFGAINQVFALKGEPERAIVFDATKANPVVIFDEHATDLSGDIATILGASPDFVPLVQSFGLPAAAAPFVAQLLGLQYGKARSATENDLFVLPSSSVIGKVNTEHLASIILQSGGLLSQTLAGQFSAEGVTLPLADKWVLTPQEQAAIKTATDAYNAKIKSVVDANPNLALVDLNAILQQASTTGIPSGDFLLTTQLVTGGLVSLDGIHLTARGYAVMANKMLEAIDGAFGSNFTKATNGLADPGNYPTNYHPSMR